MKLKSLISVVLISSIAVGVSAQQRGKAKGGPPHKWRVQQLHKDNNEGIAVGDIDGDGMLDISAGEYWYQAPEFKQRMVRKLEAFGTDFLENNSEHLYDMDGDGDLDVLAGKFKTSIVYWYENPGAGKYDVEAWTAHKLIDTGTAHNEATFLHDIDGDGTPEFIENSWNAKDPTQIVRLHRGDSGEVTATQHFVSDAGNGHGMGFGNINGDGKQDIVFLSGWFEQPKDEPFSRRWRYHHDFDLPHASCPMLVVDLNKDGRKDFIWADAHNYGLYWHEQLKRQADGTTTWPNRSATGHSPPRGQWFPLTAFGCPSSIPPMALRNGPSLSKSTTKL